MARGTAMPKRRNSSLPWYSWIFKATPGCASRGASIPARIVTAHGLTARFERLAAIELKRLVDAMILARESCERLHRGRRQRAQHLGDKRAAAHMAHGVVQALAKSALQVGADQPAVLGSDDTAAARVRYTV